MKNKMLVFFCMLFVSISLISCGNTDHNKQNTQIDREGNPISVKDDIQTIISFSPNITQVLVDLGLKEKLIAVDSYSYQNDVFNSEVIVFEDMLKPDLEFVMSMNPDIIFSSSMNKAGEEDPFKAIGDAGITIAYIPTSQSIEEIKKDIEFIAAVTKTEKIGKDIVDHMMSEIDEIAKIGKTIKEKKTVYFEISPAPYMYSFGKGVFLDDLINIIGAENIFNDVDQWLSVSDEEVPKRNPDVILTNTDYQGNDAIEEIKSRKGWSDISAIKNHEVYSIDTNATSLSNHNIVIGLKEMAKAIYPDKY